MFNDQEMSNNQIPMSQYEDWEWQSTAGPTANTGAWSFRGHYRRHLEPRTGRSGPL